ncbi:divalent cation transporter [Dictyocaulus viviparus]|uniref:Divalent cation transporter n=1 Tax=Dictyocaulus viviparus TaxID=29172 RepID=A0A0D8XNT7_DICVI|nr:divalent cation transporter [Dictyocaulus viviparus]
MALKKAPLTLSEKTESSTTFFVQTLIPFLFAGVGLIFAGLLLEEAETWLFFTELPDAITLVPTLVGMKGNLEMTLASRLSTLANLGFMEMGKQRWQVALSNMALIQTQAIVISSIAVVPAIILGEKPFMIREVLCLLLSAVATASLASLILGLLMIGVVIAAKKWKVNPDNITTPVAASLGDVTTLFTLLGIGTSLLKITDYHYWIPIVILVCFYAIAIISAYIAAKDQFTVEVLKHGWWAVLVAMSITTLSGFVLKNSLRSYPPIAAFQPLINGVGGNLVAVQASRISTSLHRARKDQVQDKKSLWVYMSPWHAFMMNHADSIAARILMAISIPGNLVFISTIFIFGCGFANTIPFTLSFITVSLIQIVILLYLCQLLVRVMWKVRIDPDSSAIPILTATGDLLGSLLLIGCFWFSSNFYGMHFTNDHFIEEQF